MAYAKQHGLAIAMPAGGCLLTNARTADRYADLAANSPEFSLNDFKLLAWGRHFRINPSLKFIIARDDGENDMLYKLVRPDDTVLIMKDLLGPLGILRGAYTQEEARLACSIFTKYTRARTASSAAVELAGSGTKRVIEVVPAGEEVCSKYRI